MKKLLISLFLCLVSMTTFAQDVIKKLDGTSINAKVQEVSQTEIKYKLFDNQTGPTYTISKNGIQSIFYENGTVDEILKVEMETKLSKKGKNLKIASWIVGGAMVAGGLILASKAQSDYNSSLSKVGDRDAAKEDYNTLTGWALHLLVPVSHLGQHCIFLAEILKKKQCVLIKHLCWKMILILIMECH